MTLLFLNDILLPLSNLLGEESIPNPVPASRTNFIQAALLRISRLYDFDWMRQVFSVTMTGGTGTLDTSLRTDPSMDVRQVVTGFENDVVLREVDRADFDNYGQGDNVYYVVQSPASSTVQIVTTEIQIPILTVTASVNFPVVSAVQGIYFPDPMVIAKFALILFREGEDKDADTSVEEAKAQAALQELIAAEVRNNAPGRAVTSQELIGDHTGNVDNSPYAAQWYS